MDFKKHIVRAWELTWQFIVSLVLMTLVMSGVAVITLGVLAPVTMAGYMQSILLMIREGREDSCLCGRHNWLYVANYPGLPCHNGNILLLPVYVATYD